MNHLRALCIFTLAFLLLTAADRSLLWQHRNLGKAFYENPTTQAQAVDEFKKALDLAPDSAREQLNYGLALLRAGKTAEGIAQLEKAQKPDPTCRTPGSISASSTRSNARWSAHYRSSNTW